eukprot:2118925-Pleurochrysis_carterae.AAC.1
MLSESNTELRVLFQTLTHNTYRAAPNVQACDCKRAIRYESIMCNLARIRSQKTMVLLTARLSLAGLRAQLPRPFWQMANALCPGLLASRDWAHEFATFASEFRPLPTEPKLQGIGA